MAILGGGAVSHERNIPVGRKVRTLVARNRPGATGGVSRSAALPRYINSLCHLAASGFFTDTVHLNDFYWNLINCYGCQRTAPPRVSGGKGIRRQLIGSFPEPQQTWPPRIILPEERSFGTLSLYLTRVDCLSILNLR